MAKSLRSILLLMFLTVNLGHVKCQTITTVAAEGDNSNEMTATTVTEYQPTGIGAANSNEMTETTGIEYQPTGPEAANSNEVTETTGMEYQPTGIGAANSNEMTATTGMEYQPTGPEAANSNEMTETTVTEYQPTGPEAANSNEMTGETTSVPMTTVKTTGVPSNPACPVELTTLKINVPKLLGVWFLIESYPQMPVVYSSCELFNITYVSPNSFRVNSFMFHEPTSSSSVTSSGDSSELAADSYLMTVNRNFILQHVDVQCTSNPKIQMTNWAILAANFKEYAIHYACAFEDGKFLGQRVHIVSRYRNPSSEIMAKAYKAMERFGLSTKPLVNINQSLKTCVQYSEYQEMLKLSEQMLGDWKKPHHHKRPSKN